MAFSHNRRELIHMTYANAEERKDLIAGLRCLADFLEKHTEIPSPRWTDVMVSPSTMSDVEALKDVDAIAALIGAQIEDRKASHAHYTASRYFGPVQYRAVAILSKASLCQEPQQSNIADVVASSTET
jgi:hypothetical protein